jgi:hypothetical protein
MVTRSASGQSSRQRRIRAECYTRRPHPYGILQSTPGLAVGDRLGPYEMLASIGEGGMGEVWKARDTRLDRIVALKISKAQFSERFEREARSIAALNHPHICQLYERQRLPILVTGLQVVDNLIHRRCDVGRIANCAVATLLLPRVQFMRLRPSVRERRRLESLPAITLASALESGQ